MRNPMRSVLAVAAAAAASLALLPAAGATAAPTERSTASAALPAGEPLFEIHTATLAPVPHDPQADGGSSTTGRVAYVRLGSALIVLEIVNGAAPNLPHAQHTHGIGEGRCPTADRAGDDGLISTVEGLPDYGGIQISLTTSGDTSAASGLAVDRYPVASFFGSYLYGRVLTIGTDVPAEVGYNIDQYHTVVHGIDVNNNGEYDFAAGESSLDPALPLEATVPAACGQID